MRCSEPGMASGLQSWRPVRRVAELGSLGALASSMRFRNIQFTSPETDRKVMLPASFFVMLLIWILCVTVLGFIGLAAFSSGDTFVWDTEHKVIVASLSILSVVIIPIQLVRYVRERRALR
jgi:hypothetical protein